VLLNSYKISSSVHLSRLSPYIDEITEYHQCSFRHNRSTTDHIFCICQVLEKKREYSETVHKLFIDSYYSVRRELLYNILMWVSLITSRSPIVVLCLHLRKLCHSVKR
jgi:hypothetical protein